MRRLNAVDAIGPAWAHTQALMFAPRRWKLILKVSAVAFFAQMGGCSSNFNRVNAPAGHIPALHHFVVAMLLAIALVSLAIGLVLFYIGSRLQFVLFEVVLRRDTWIGPIWRRYGAATWRWIWLKIVFWIVAMLCAAPFLVPVILLFVHNLSRAGGGKNADFGVMFGTILGFLGAIFVALIVISCVYSLLADFGLPSMALEGTPMGETVRRVTTLIRMEPGQVLLYLLMRFVLSIACAIAGYLVLGVVALILLIPLGGAALVLWAALHTGSLGAHIVMVAGWVVLGAIMAALLFVGVMVLFGTMITWMQAYALYFLGGRYRLVGEYLEPEPVFVAPPPMPWDGGEGGPVVA
jgi:hypothetical protein